VWGLGAKKESQKGDREKRHRPVGQPDKTTGQMRRDGRSSQTSKRKRPARVRAAQLARRKSDATKSREEKLIKQALYDLKRGGKEKIHPSENKIVWQVTARGSRINRRQEKAKRPEGRRGGGGKRNVTY